MALHTRSHLEAMSLCCLAGQFFLSLMDSAVGFLILPSSVLVVASFTTRSCLLISSNLWGLLPVSKEASQPPSQPCWTLSRPSFIFISSFVAASLHCIPILTTFGPAISQACLVAALAFFIPCPNENHDGLAGLPGSPASPYPLPLGSTLSPRALQVLGDSWPARSPKVPGPLIPSY